MYLEEPSQKLCWSGIPSFRRRKALWLIPIWYWVRSKLTKLDAEARSRGRADARPQNRRWVPWSHGDLTVEAARKSAPTPLHLKVFLFLGTPLDGMEKDDSMEEQEFGRIGAHPAGCGEFRQPFLPANIFMAGENVPDDQFRKR